MEDLLELYKEKYGDISEHDPEVIEERMAALRKEIEDSKSFVDKSVEFLKSFNDTRQGVSEQALIGAGEVLPTAALGTMRTLQGVENVLQGEEAEGRFGRGGDWLEKELEKRRDETAPEGKLESAARIGGRMAGEVGLFAGGSAGAARAGLSGLSRMSVPAMGDVAFAQAGPEESAAGALAQVTGSETLRGLSENDLGRTLFEVGLGAVPDALMGGLRGTPKPRALDEDTYKDIVQAASEGNEEARALLIRIEKERAATEASTPEGREAEILEGGDPGRFDPDEPIGGTVREREIARAEREAAGEDTPLFKDPENLPSDRELDRLGATLMDEAGTDDLGSALRALDDDEISEIITKTTGQEAPVRKADETDEEFLSRVSAETGQDFRIGAESDVEEFTPITRAEDEALGVKDPVPVDESKMTVGEVEEEALNSVLRQDTDPVEFERMVNTPLKDLEAAARNLDEVGDSQPKQVIYDAMREKAARGREAFKLNVDAPPYRELGVPEGPSTPLPATVRADLEATGQTFPQAVEQVRMRMDELNEEMMTDIRSGVDPDSKAFQAKLEEVHALRGEQDAYFKMKKEDITAPEVDETLIERFNSRFLRGGIRKGPNEVLSADAWRRTYQEWWDKDFPLAVLSKNLDVSSGVDPAALARSIYGAPTYAENMLNFGVRGPLELGSHSRGFNQIVRDSGDPETLENFLSAHRANEYELVKHADGVNTRGGIPTAEIDEAIKKGNKNTKVVQAAEEMRHYNHQMLYLLESEGVIPKGAAERIIGANNEAYMPFFRVFEEESGKVGETIGRVSVESKPLKTRSGDGRGLKIFSPMESVVQQAHIYAELIHRRRLLTSLQDAARNHPDNGYVRGVSQIPESARPIKSSGNLDEILPESVLNEMDSNSRAAFTPKRDGQTGKTYVTISDVETGKPLHYEIDTSLIDALSMRAPTEFNALQKVFIGSGRSLRAGVTSMPDFWVANVFRDTFTAAITSEAKNIRGSGLWSTVGHYSGVTPLARAWGDFANGLFRLAKDEADALKGVVREGHIGRDPDSEIRQMGNAGGFQGALTSMDRSELQKGLRAHNANKQTVMGTYERMWHKTLDILNTPGRVTEDASRLGEFMRAKKYYISKGFDEGSAIQMAARDARDVTVDFGRRGSRFDTGTGGEFYRLSSAFWNASTQGHSRIFRAFIHDPVKATRVAATTITMPTLALYAINRKNGDYQDLPGWAKAGYWHIPIPGDAVDDVVMSVGEGMLADMGGGYMANILKPFVRGDNGTMFLRLPRPHELGWVFATMPEAIFAHFDDANKMRHSDLDAGTRDMARDYMAQLLPIPTLGKLLMGASANWMGFTGRPQVSEYEMATPQSSTERGRDSASEFGKWVSGGLNDLGVQSVPVMPGARPIDPNPRAIDTFVQGIFGGAGRAGLDVADRFMQERGTGPRPKGHWQTEGIFARRFFTDHRTSSKSSEDFYEELNELEAKHQDFRSKIKSPNRQREALMEEMTASEKLRYSTHKELADRVHDMMEEIIKIERGGVHIPEEDWPELSEIKREQIDDQVRHMRLLLRISQTNNDGMVSLAETLEDEGRLTDREAGLIEQYMMINNMERDEKEREGTVRELLEGRMFEVEYVVDGDTYMLTNGVTVRDVGSFAAEMGTAEGRADSVSAAQLLNNRAVRMRVGTRPEDKHGRLLADLELPFGSAGDSLTQTRLRQGRNPNAGSGIHKLKTR